MNTPIQEHMPVITTSSGFLAMLAFAPVLAAATAVVTPAQIDAYTMVGATIAMFLAMAYLWVKAPGLKLVNVFFTGLSAFAVGWLLPEPLAWGLAHMGWLNDTTVAGFPRKLWGLLGLVCGLSGTTLVLVSIYWAQSRLPDMLLRKGEDEVARVRWRGGSEVEIKKIAHPDSENKTP